MTDRGASMLEVRAPQVPSGHYDVVILGGGLAGLSLALQLKRERPATRVLVTDKRSEPAPEAAFKVGESSVEIGAYYYREVCGMRDHLEEAQLRKLGLRFHLPAGDNSDISSRVEFCTPAHLSAFTHQIDRGRFENELFRRGKKAGADSFRGWRVLDVELSEGGNHKVTLGQDEDQATVSATWVVDASGRANILRRKLGIGTDTGHHINAAWIRLAGGLDYEEAWGGDNEAWLDRMPDSGLRRLSTTHLIAEGYWLWLIQLASGPISIGVCADPRVHPYEEIESFDAWMVWLQKNEPQLYAEIDGRREDVLDFLRVKDFSYSSERFFSKDRWTLVGEAGGFLDALYSPGSDFIALSNSFSAELIKADLDGEGDLGERVEFYNDFYMALFETTGHLYRDNYQLFSNPQVFAAKAVYDSSNYFTFVGSAFLHGKLTKREDIERLEPLAHPMLALLVRLQELFRDWHALEQTRWEGISILSQQFAPYIEAQESMTLPMTDDEWIEKTKENIEYLKALAVWIFHRAARNLPEPPDPNAAINPLAISLKPENWEEDGLFADDGITLPEALERLPGIAEIDLEARDAAVTS
jgi:flavin-dependent dehydrogenase